MGNKESEAHDQGSHKTYYRAHGSIRRSIDRAPKKPKHHLHRKVLNLRLIRASAYIQRFHLDVRYKPGKTNTVPNALSRLASREFRPTEEARSKAYQINCYPATLVELSPEFK